MFLMNFLYCKRAQKCHLASINQFYVSTFNRKSVLIYRQMTKKIFILSIIFVITSCSQGPSPDQELVEYKEKSINQSQFVKSVLHQGFLLYGKNLVLNLKDNNTFQELKQKALEVELENLFIQSIADQNKIIVKDEELTVWIEKRTKGLTEEELEYFLNYSNMSIKEWKALFKNQLLKEKVLKLYTTRNENREDVNHVEGLEKQKHYQVATLTFDSTIEAQNIYKELKAFPKRLDDLLIQRKGTKTYDWITQEDELIYNKIKNLRKGGLTKPFESPWGHMIVKFFKSEKRHPNKPAPMPKEQAQPAKTYLRDLMAFKENKDLKINLKAVYGLEIK